MYQTRLKEIIDLSFKSVFEKINGGIITVDNEASLQLHLSSIIKNIGDLYIYKKEEIFSIELEKSVVLSTGTFVKSNSSKAKIDIFLSIENVLTKELHNCAIELKFFKKVNHREPNNRYDVFKDISNLESYGEFCTNGVLLVATDHEHYISQTNYSDDTGDFDFRDGSKYLPGTQLTYKTPKPYGDPILLSGKYDFSWSKAAKGISFMILDIESLSE